MTAPARRRLVVFAVPMIVALVAAQRAAAHVRTVDFVILFTSGVLVGVTLLALVQLYRREGGGERP